jgi:hypothetical protein
MISHGLVTAEARARARAQDRSMAKERIVTLVEDARGKLKRLYPSNHV